jgi:hypothetical protein
MTPDEQAEKIQTDIYRGMTPEQKWEIVLGLRRMARGMKEAWLRHLHPDWSDRKVESELKRWFGNDRA